jgi:zinc transport system ATP-binding protein
MSHAPSDPPLVEIERLTIRRQREVLLDEVSLRVARGTLHMIVGPNGAGKSTLLAAVLGQAAFDGQIVMHWRGSGAIGYVPQTFIVDPTLPVTVEDFLALTRQRLPVCLGITAAARETIRTLLHRVGLSDLQHRALAVLSGGELRRVLLAHALDPEPELLILDEPASGLDEAAAQWFEEALSTIRAAGRVTVLMVSHDIEHVQRVADRVTVLDRRVVAEGSAAEIVSSTAVRHFLPQRAEQRARR